jgi:hypothetical protein
MPPTIQKLTEAKGIIGRVYYEGENPDIGHISVVLMLLQRDGYNMFCFLRVASNPDLFQIGGSIQFNKDTVFYEDEDGDILQADKVNPAFIHYKQPGIIYKGG